jgi:acyl-CoA dehydrogenase
MRLIGMAERALELLCRRALERTAFGKPVAAQGVVGEWIAEARCRIEQARLLVLKTAWLMDTAGNRGAHTEIQAIKIIVPEMAGWVLDKAIQAHGGAGVSQDFPLAAMWAGARSLRLADGPDEVHKMSLAKSELRKYSALARGVSERSEGAPQGAPETALARGVSERSEGAPQGAPQTEPKA